MRVSRLYMYLDNAFVGFFFPNRRLDFVDDSSWYFFTFSAFIREGFLWYGLFFLHFTYSMVVVHIFCFLIQFSLLRYFSQNVILSHPFRNIVVFHHKKEETNIVVLIWVFLKHHTKALHYTYSHMLQLILESRNFKMNSPHAPGLWTHLCWHAWKIFYWNTYFWWVKCTVGPKSIRGVSIRS